ncbi:MAG: type VII secretion protein EccE [Rhodococcus sp. (in: high G+C Gram-positive bacteria)]|uniref:type VII secretion protein EccE n=1 Tax=Rhodococcus sp. TaxID=1831 RepID=UPI003BB4F8C0
MDRVESAWAQRFGLVRLVTAQCVAVAIWMVASVSGASTTIAASAAACVATVAFVRVRGRGVSDLGIVVWRYGTRRYRRPNRPVDHPDGTGTIGLIRDGTCLSAVVEILAPSEGITRLGRDRIDPDRVVPLSTIARCLSHHDVTLDAIDVIAHGRRVLDTTPAGQVYAQLVGPLPAASVCTVRVALRLDASRCRDAVSSRGGGAEGAVRTIMIAARRVERALGESQLRARILTAAEIDSATARITRDADPADFERRWRSVPLPGGFNSGGSVEPRRLDRGTLTGIWSHPALSSTVAVRLRPGSAPGRVRIGALVRVTTRSCEPFAAPGLRPVRGRDRDALVAALPLAVPGLENMTQSRSTAAADLDALTLPIAGCGQLVGADESGRAVAARLTGSGVRSVHVAGELYLALQVVFRAVAVGARVVVHTDRPHAWQPVLDGAAGPDRLRIAGRYPGDVEFDTVVYDGVRPTVVPPHVTALHIHTGPEQWPRERPDVTLVQPGAAGNRVILGSGGRRTSLTLVTIDAETTHIGRPRTTAPVVAR